MKTLPDHTADISCISTLKLVNSLYEVKSQIEGEEILSLPPSSSTLVAQVSVAVNQLALRVVRISVSDQARKARMQGCKQSLVTLGSKLSPLSPPETVIAAADQLFESCVESLKLVDLNVLEEVEKSGQAALDCLTELKDSEDYFKLFLNIRVFGAKLVKFIENSVQR